MSKHIEKIRNAFREAQHAHRLPENVDTDRLAVVSMSMALVKRFHEGYFGTELMAKKIEEGRELRLTDPARYQRKLDSLEPHLKDLRSIRREMKVIETLTSSDLAYAIAANRDSVERNLNPVFTTDLFDPAITRKRIVDDLNPIRTRGGVDLSQRFLQKRAEITNTQYTSWSGRGSYFTVNNWELAIAYTAELRMQDNFGELQDAAYEMGQNAVRTRALVIVDAIFRHAYRLVLPYGANGPTVDNLTAALNYMADQTVDGRHFSRSPSDIFLANVWRVVANTSLKTQTVPAQSGQVGAQPNPVFELLTPHSEQVLSEIDYADYPGFSRRDQIIIDRTTQPIDFAAMRGFENGPQTLIEVPQTVDLNFGSFDNLIFRWKCSDWTGAGIGDSTGVLVASGQNG